MVDLHSSAVCVAFAPQRMLGDGTSHLHSWELEECTPGRDEAATATGSLEDGSRVVGLISSKDEGGRAIRMEVEHVPLRRQGTEWLV